MQLLGRVQFARFLFPVREGVVHDPALEYLFLGAGLGAFGVRRDVGQGELVGFAHRDNNIN